MLSVRVRVRVGVGVRVRVRVEGEGWRNFLDYAIAASFVATAGKIIED